MRAGSGRAPPHVAVLSPSPSLPGGRADVNRPGPARTGRGPSPARYGRSWGSSGARHWPWLARSDLSPFLTNWLDGTRPGAPASDTRWTLTCGYGFRRTGRTLSIDLRIRRSLEGNGQLSSSAYHCPSAGHSSPYLRGQPWASVPRPRSTLVLGEGITAWDCSGGCSRRDL